MVGKVQRKLAKRDRGGVVHQWFHAEEDRKAIAAWRVDLKKIIQVFEVCSVTWARPVADFQPPE